MEIRNLKARAEQISRHRDDIYDVGSIHLRSLMYYADRERFAVARGGKAIVCKWEEIPEVAEMCGREDIREEIREIHKDLLSLKSMWVIWAQN